MHATNHATVRAFDFLRDRFAFVNELLWEYQFDAATGKSFTTHKHPKPDYALRCFVMTRAAKQFFLHACFDPTQDVANDESYRIKIRQITSRSPRAACAPSERVIFPGFTGLHDFSQVCERLLKDECGGAWRSYVLRSHWRMVLPISRTHQARTAARLVARVRAGSLPILHLVTFPQLTINHGVLLYAAHQRAGGWDFTAYDPNLTGQPMTVAYDASTRSFSVPRNNYWPGGRLKVIEIYRNWFF